MSKIIEDLNWRYATKRFDATRKINDKDLEVIKESLRLVPSSYGLQPLKYLLVESNELREQLVQASYGQKQVQDASHLIVICSHRRMEEEQIDAYLENVANTREIDLNSTKGYGDFMKQTIAKMSAEEIASWNDKQAYIALGQLLHTCASLRIDATPMEGFDADKYAEILNVDKNDYKINLVCPIGYRHKEDVAQNLKKVRKAIHHLFEIK